jgi:bifunctional UDP-N-acetylglucosamine pyrophosphorylase / glucosamine-1-phosphate N-acetyltransferase
LGINTKVELAEADRILRMRKAEELMLAGVTIERPETVTIDADVQAGADSAIEPYARLLGATRIGEDCLVGAGAILENAILADGAKVLPYTLIADSKLEPAAQVGPFARMRMNARAGVDSRIGNFVELKNTDFGDGAKSQHLTYLGDATVGAGSNIGAGTITCNYDGEKKHRTKIGKNVFVGSNNTIVAPVELGDGAYTAAGSTITHAVPDHALAIGRARQENKPEWVLERRNKMKH